MKTTFLSCLVIASVAILAFSSFTKRPQHAHDDEMATYYVVIADTSQSYQAVHATMDAFHRASGLEIDTMDRYFNADSNRLILREDSEDEIYRGEYFPRRFPSATLSIEYLSMYRPKSSQTAFACVTGIFEKPSQAKAFAAKWKPRFPKTFTQKAEIFIGCMH